MDSARRPEARFTNRVESYARYRPAYPTEVVERIEAITGLRPPATIADCGSGTGLSSLPFLERGYRVVGVEPNAAMRTASAELLDEYENFAPIDGSAEETRLPDRSCDLIVAGQAFHWFDRQRARREFDRIMTPTAGIALLWNDRRKESTPFLRDYEALLQRHGTDYRAVDHTNVAEREIDEFLYPLHVVSHVLYNEQVFDFEGLRGRLESSSYVPSPTDPGYGPMIDDLREVYERHARHGAVTIEYDLRMYVGNRTRV